MCVYMYVYIYICIYTYIYIYIYTHSLCSLSPEGGSEQGDPYHEITVESLLSHLRVTFCLIFLVRFGSPFGRR